MGKRILGIVVMVISVLVMIACLVGIVSVWVLRSEVDHLVTNVATVADTAVQRGQSVAGRLDTRLTTAQTSVQSATTTVTNAGAKAEDAPLALLAIEQITNKDLSPAVDELTSSAGDLRDLIARLDGTLEVLNKLPRFSNREGILDKALVLLDNVQAVSQSVADLRQGVQDRKSAAVQSGVALLSAPLNRLSTALTSAQTAVQGVQQRLTDARTSIAQMKSNVMRAVNIGVLVATLFLIWLVLSQVSFFMHGMDMFRAKPAVQAISAPAAPATDVDVAPPAERLASAEAPAEPAATQESPPAA
jgi:hypothetical protein